MKKLMIAAAAVAMVGGAFADDCSCSEPKACAFGYQLKVFVKTTAAQGLDGATTACGDTARFCVRVPATKRFAGFIYGTTAQGGAGLCGEAGACSCNEWENGSAELVFWNYDTKQEIAPKAKIIQMDRIYTGDTQTFEMAFDLDNMRFGGFGKWFYRNNVKTVKYASGFCAGVIPAEKCTAGVCGETADSKVWAMCDSEMLAPQVAEKTTVAYGKWTLDWSATIFNRVTAGEQVTQPGASWEVAKPVAFK